MLKNVFMYSSKIAGYFFGMFIAYFYYILFWIKQLLFLKIFADSFDRFSTVINSCVNRKELPLRQWLHCDERITSYDKKSVLFHHKRFSWKKMMKIIVCLILVCILIVWNKVSGCWKQMILFFLFCIRFVGWRKIKRWLENEKVENNRIEPHQCGRV